MRPIGPIGPVYVETVSNAVCSMLGSRNVEHSVASSQGGRRRVDFLGKSTATVMCSMCLLVGQLRKLGKSILQKITQKSRKSLNSKSPSSTQRRQLHLQRSQKAEVDDLANGMDACGVKQRVCVCLWDQNPNQKLRSRNSPKLPKPACTALVATNNRARPQFPHSTNLSWSHQGCALAKNQTMYFHALIALLSVNQKNIWMTMKCIIWLALN